MIQNQMSCEAKNYNTKQKNHHSGSPGPGRKMK